MDGVRTYYLYNAHGDVVNLTDSSATAIKSYDYDAFGVERNIASGDANPFRYCGEYYDKETNTYYLRARNYDPTTGRFLSKDTVHARLKNIFDPYGDYQGTQLTGGVYVDWTEGQYVVNDPLSLNLYTYSQNNPIMYSDPNGNWIHILIGAAIGFAVGGAISAVTQYVMTGKIDIGQTLIAAGTGALSGGLAATGVVLIGQIAGNTLLGAASSFGNQLYMNKGDIKKTNVTDILISAFLGGVGGALGGAGGGSTHLDSLSNQLFKRVGNAVKNQSGNALKKEITNAVSYYLKNSLKQNATIMYNVLKSYIPTVVKGGTDWIDKLFSSNEA
ncbi:hypothetical protein SDC9_150380 [bioreactor metagenome]|uniref:Teneurin-like YD-shell domain-containing protein n=1 Tax=bioreactor metagenome TaxID=1076179 RepID=A0A645EMB4_9ZZZZ